jgi:hypothetical protein
MGIRDSISSERVSMVIDYFVAEKIFLIDVKECFSLQSMLPRSEILHQSRRALEGQTLFELVKINPKDEWKHQKLS